MNQDKVRCHVCGWVGGESERLSASNPFDTGEGAEPIFGCSECLQPASFGVVCYQPGCKEFAGYKDKTTTPSRLVCGKHCSDPVGPSGVFGFADNEGAV